MFTLKEKEVRFAECDFDGINSREHTPEEIEAFAKAEQAKVEVEIEKRIKMNEEAGHFASFMMDQK